MTDENKNKPWPPDDDWPYYHYKDNVDDWNNSVGHIKCTKDSHKPADTGMRISYCKICNTKMAFIDWAWEEVENK